MLRNRVLAKYFKDLEQVIAAGYGLAPSRHSVDKGEDREEFLLSVLNNHLPQISRAYRGGMVLDCNDECSGQTDIVIYSQWSPIMHQNRKPLFLAEGTYAAIEVKSVLTSTHLKDALQASARFKRMKKCLFPKESGIISFSQTSTSVCTGLFAYTSRMKPEKVRDALLSHYKAGTVNREMIDFVCVNGQYCFRRLRSEDIAMAVSFGPEGEIKKPLGEYQRECRYVYSPHSFGIMFSTILSYISYVGPVQQWFDTYLHDRG